ncbi:MAG: glycerophosphodiester phosphodiesterase family protein [Bacteroidota bacterium]
MANTPIFRRRWVQLILVLISLFVIIKIYNLDPFGPEAQQTEPIIIAHRGWSSQAPENTLAAIRKALEVNADMIEFDVHLCKDKVPVVIHDPTLERTTNGSGAVQDKSLFELRQLDAGTWFGEDFADERIPTLSEVMALVQGKCPLLIELKWDEEGAVYSGLVDSVLAEIDRFGAVDWCVIQSFDAGMIREVREKAPEIEAHKLILLDLPILPGHIDRQWQWTDGSHFDEGVSAINLWLKGLNPRVVNRIHADGKKVFVYTVNEEADIDYCRKLGVDGVITDGFAKR